MMKYYDQPVLLLYGSQKSFSCTYIPAFVCLLLAYFFRLRITLTNTHTNDDHYTYHFSPAFTEKFTTVCVWYMKIDVIFSNISSSFALHCIVDSA
ncbi:hypothetical protein QL285_015591 [Trifolium repens]|nr:hypothetical protein QL285_015591 [Trifolium repens]